MVPSVSQAAPPPSAPTPPKKRRRTSLFLPSYEKGLQFYRDAQPTEQFDIDHGPPAFDRDKLRKAYDIFSRHAEANPDNVEAVLMTAQTAYDLNDAALMEQAKPEVERIFRADPKNALALHIWGCLMNALQWNKLDDETSLRKQIGNRKQVLTIDPEFSTDLGASTAHPFGKTNNYYRQELQIMEESLKDILREN